MQTNPAITSTNTPRGQTYTMSKKAQQLAEESVTRKKLLISLSENQCFGDAIMLLSYAMPHQKGLQWALKCVRNSDQYSNNSNRETADTDKQKTLEFAEKWLNEPNEKNRARILPSKVVAQPSAATWLAMAAYWSGGSISDAPIIESAPNELVHDSIYSSVMLSVQEAEEKYRINAYSEAINQGIKLLYS